MQALDLADFYLAIRGESASAFRDRIVKAFLDASRTAKVPGKVTTENLDGEVRAVEFVFADPKQYVQELQAWATHVAQLFADMELASAEPDGIRRRGEALAAWLDDEAKGILGKDSTPCPLPCLEMPSPPSTYGIEFSSDCENDDEEDEEEED